MGAQWIVFDGIDVLLTLLQNPSAEMREIYRIRDWLADNELNAAIITAKIDGDGSEIVNYGFLQFMVDCVVRFDRRLEQGVALHRLQITKYRGSDYVAGEYPVSFGPSGMEVGAPEAAEIKQVASGERVSAGFERLDTMLGGGLFRGSSTLITGVPGTSKTTLAGKFVEAACRRGERTLFVSFDEGADRIARNLTSVGIQLKTHVKSGLLRMYSGRTESIGAEDHLVKLKALIREHRPRCMVIDPISSIAKAGGIDRQHHEIAHDARHLADDRAQVVAALDRKAGQLEGGRRRLVGHRRDDVEHEVATDQPEHGGYVVGRDRLSGKRHHLIERALRIAHAALGRPRNQQQRRILRHHLLRVGDGAKVAGDAPAGDRLELEDLRARQHRLGDL